jgi:hypothetical protein
MEKESLFEQLSKGYEEKEKLEGAKKFLKKEIEEDISVFSDEERSLVELYIQGKLIPKEQSSIFSKALERWWRDKYGFSYGNINARNEVLARKYSPSEKQRKKKQLSEELLLAVAENREEKVKELKEKYQADFPDELEGIEVLFGMRDMFISQKKFEAEKGKMTHEERRAQFRDFTEYQFLMTHYVLLNGDDKAFLEKFWQAARHIADQASEVNEFNILRRGQMGQVATYRVLEQLGEKPKLSHPDEDAFEAIDLWTEGDTAIQVKSWDEDVPAVAETDHLVFPSAQVDESKKKSHLYSSAEFFNGKNRIFRAKIKEYGKHLGKDLKGYMLVVPYSKIDFVTGEPAPELVEFFRQELKIDKGKN